MQSNGVTAVGYALRVMIPFWLLVACSGGGSTSGGGMEVANPEQVAVAVSKIRCDPEMASLLDRYRIRTVKDLPDNCSVSIKNRIISLRYEYIVGINGKRNAGIAQGCIVHELTHVQTGILDHPPAFFDAYDKNRVRISACS